MNKALRFVLSIALIAILSASLIPSSRVAAEAPQPPGDSSVVEIPPDDLDWDARFYVNGIVGTVDSMVFDPAGGLYAGGDFSQAGKLSQLNHVAYWNGSYWRPLERGTNGRVNVLLLDQAGNLYVGGNFDQAGGEAIANLAVFSTVTQTWSALPGFPYSTDRVTSMALDAVDNVLYVGTSRRVVRYDVAAHTFTEWATATNKSVLALAYDGTNHVLYAGGNFSTINGVSVKNVARYNGSTWQAMGAGFAVGLVDALVLDETNHVIAGGSFSSPGKGVARWDGSAWQPLGSGINSGVAFTLIYDLSNRVLYAAGDSQAVYSWNANTSSWTTLGDAYAGGYASFSSLALHNGELFLGGDFNRLGEVPTTGVGKWNGSVWQALDTAPGMGISTGLFPDEMIVDNSGGVVVGGDFDRAGTTLNLSNISRFNGTAWEPLGGGVDNSVTALAVDGSQLYVGGSFGMVGGAWDAVTKAFTGRLGASRVARWSGTEWSALGQGLTGNVMTLSTNGNGVLYAGGNFTATGSGLPASKIAKWDGKAWTALSEGALNGVNGNVFALAQNPAGDVYVGGCFTQAVGKSSLGLAVYRVSTQTWQTIGNVFNTGSCVYALKYDIPSNKLLIGGSFTTVNSNEANGIVMADPSLSTWTTFVENNQAGLEFVGGSGYVDDLQMDGSGRIYAGGLFNQAGGKPVGFVARWNGSGWDNLGSGVNNQIKRLGLTSTGLLYMVGSFDKAGPYNASFITAFRSGPGGVKLVSPSNDQLFENMPKTLPLIWQAYPGAKGYEVQVLGYEDYSLVRTFKSKKPVLVLSKKYLQPIDGPFFWRVRAMNGKLPLSGWSGLYEFRLPLRAVQPVYPMPNAKMVDLQPLFVWETPHYPAVISQYQFELYSDARLHNKIWQAMVFSPDPYLLPLTLRPNTNYFWRVRFLAGNGQYSLWSKTAKFTTIK
jgi:hypothetical protein